VRRIDHSGKRLRIETAKGTVNADRAIVTVPTSILTQAGFFLPRLPAKTEAAEGLPLGLDDKLFVSLERAEEFEEDSRLFGRTDRSGTGAYHLRPFGRPMIECYFGGTLAAELEAQGDRGFFAQRVRPIGLHCWRADPFARGSYSYARPSKADLRAVLAAPVDDRLFFAGEACSRADYSTAHGGYFTGVAAADAVMAARRGA
jgi:monoamine oxidase